MDRQRIDKWLWHARVVRTRSAAAALAASGHVRINGQRIDAASRAVRPGDVVTVEVEGLGALENHIVAGPTPIRDDVGAQPTASEEVLSTALGGDWEFRGIRPPQRS